MECLSRGCAAVVSDAPKAGSSSPAVCELQQLPVEFVPLMLKVWHWKGHGDPAAAHGLGQVPGSGLGHSTPPADLARGDSCLLLKE